MHKWVAVFETTDFNIENKWEIEVSGFLDPKGQITIMPTEDTVTKIMVEFETDQISKPPILQIAVGKSVLADFLDYMRLQLSSNIQVSLKELSPATKETEEEYSKIADPRNWTFPSETTKVTEGFERFTKEFQQIYSPRVGMATDHEKWEVFYMMRRLLHWYGKSLESKQTADRLIGMWISFNILYSFVWKTEGNEKDAHDWKKVQHFAVKSPILNPEQCRELVEDSLTQFLVYKTFEGSELMKEFKSACSEQKWKEALNSALQAIRICRNGIFHGSWVPEKSFEGMLFSQENQPLEVATQLLSKTLKKSCHNLLQTEIS